MDSDCSSAAAVSLTNITVEQADDAGIFIQRIADTSIVGLQVGTIGLAEVPSSLGGGQASDGLVVTGRDLDSAAELTSDLTMEVDLHETITIGGPVRAAIIVDTAELNFERSVDVESMRSEDSWSGAYLQNGSETDDETLFIDLGDGDEDFLPLGGPLCLNLGSPSMESGGPTVSSALACSPF
jgi:hypothetical protein